MKKNELIKKLQAIEGNPEVVIYDHKRNFWEDDGDDAGCSAGIYPKIEIINFDKPEVKKGKPFIALSFTNLFFEEEK